MEVVADGLGNNEHLFVVSHVATQVLSYFSFSACSPYSKFGVTRILCTLANVSITRPNILVLSEAETQVIPDSGLFFHVEQHVGTILL